MVAVEDYVARIEGTCGEEKDVIVIFKYDKKDDVIAKILKRAEVEKSISRIIFDLRFKGISFRIYANGKAIFRGVKDRDELNRTLADLLV